MLFALIAAAVVSTAPVLAQFEYRVDASTWTVEPVGASNDGAHFELTSLRITDHGKLVQEIKLKEPEVVYLNGGWIESEDYDFDGFKDLYVTTVGGSGGVPGFLLRFDPKTGVFLKPHSLPNAHPDRDRRLVHTGWRFGYCCGWDNEVRFVPGKFKPIILKRVDRTRSNGPDAPIIKTVEERDEKGQMRVACRMELEDSVEQPVLKVLEGDLKRCLHEGEN